MRRLTAACAVSGLILAPCWAASALTYDEAQRGDLSGVSNAPTPLTFDTGPNIVRGVMGGDLGDGIPVDRDIFTFTLLPTQSLAAINVLALQPAGASFYAIAPGTSISLTDASGHLANTLVSAPGQELLARMLNSYSGGTGISKPLGPGGTYTVWFQELSSVTSYSIEYVVTESPTPTNPAALRTVPLPAWSLALGSLALAALGARVARGR
jgi:hypothetical protein